MAPRIRQVLPHAVMLAASIALFWAAMRIDVDTGGRIGPGAWPKAIIVILGLLCAWEIAKRLLKGEAAGVKGLVAGLTDDPAQAAEGEVAAGAPPAEHPRKLWAGIALVTAYVVGAPWVGFFVATLVFLAAFPWIGGFRRPVIASAIALSGSLLLVVTFMRIAYISLPLGEGPFRALSLALMRAIGVS
jgi:hypothetical protein